MHRVRLFCLSVLAAVAVALGSTAVTGTYIIDCERDDPSPCVQAALGFPLLYVVDHPAVSPAGSADLIGAALGLDLFIASNFWADVLFWWFGALSVWMAFARRRTTKQGP